APETSRRSRREDRSLRPARRRIRTLKPGRARRARTGGSSTLQDGFAGCESLDAKAAQRFSPRSLPHEEADGGSGNRGQSEEERGSASDYPLPPRVVLSMQFLHTLAGDVRIDLRRRQIAVS